MTSPLRAVLTGYGFRSTVSPQAPLEPDLAHAVHPNIDSPLVDDAHADVLRKRGGRLIFAAEVRQEVVERANCGGPEKGSRVAGRRDFSHLRWYFAAG